MIGSAAAHPAPDVAPPATRWAEYDTTYLLECLAAWRALSADDVVVGELEAELLDRGEIDG